MKPLKEALISKDKKDWASTGWPNPYNLTKNDQRGFAKNLPLEIMTLAIYECSLKNSSLDGKRLLQKAGVTGTVNWSKSKDGFDFWLSISNGNYKVFYDTYTPELLKQRLEK